MIKLPPYHINVYICHVTLKLSKMRNTQNWTLFEEGVVHTTNLTEKEANEMLERYESCFKDLCFWIDNIIIEY